MIEYGAGSPESTHRCPCNFFYDELLDSLADFLGHTSSVHIFSTATLAFW